MKSCPKIPFNIETSSSERIPLMPAIFQPELRILSANRFTKWPLPNSRKYLSEILPRFSLVGSTLSLEAISLTIAPVERKGTPYLRRRYLRTSSFPEPFCPTAPITLTLICIFLDYNYQPLPLLKG